MVNRKHVTALGEVFRTSKSDTHCAVEDDGGSGEPGRDQSVESTYPAPESKSRGSVSRILLTTRCTTRITASSMKTRIHGGNEKDQYRQKHQRVIAEATFQELNQIQACNE